MSGTPPDPRIVDAPGAGNGNAGNNGNDDGGPTIVVPDGPPRSRRIQMLEAKLFRTYTYPAKYLMQVAVATQDEVLFEQVKEYAEILVPQVVDAWCDLAAQSPRVLEMLEKGAEGGSIGTLIGLHLIMVTKLLPPETTQKFMQRAVVVVMTPFANRKARRGGDDPAA